MKTVLVIRLGALGDVIMITPLLKLLKLDGYHVTVNVPKYSSLMLDNNPNVDEVLIHDAKIENQKLKEYWKKLGNGYDRVINLSGSIEESLLKIGRGVRLDKETRVRLGEINYYDETLRLGGYENVRGLNGELFFSDKEERFAKNIKKRYSKCFTILWSLSGSSTHKSYPYTEFIARTLFAKHMDIIIITVGDEICKLLEWKHKKTKNKVGIWKIRKSMAVAKYVDLVIGPQTGMLAAAGCFSTPKIVLLSHSVCKNLCKYWENHQCLHSEVSCYPCHQIHYSNDSCILDEELQTPVCMAKLAPITVYQAIEAQYKKWKDG